VSSSLQAELRHAIHNHPGAAQPADSQAHAPAMLQVKRPELRKRLKKREDERKVRATDQKQLQQDLFGDDDELQDLEDEEQRRWGAAEAEAEAALADKCRHRSVAHDAISVCLPVQIGICCHHPFWLHMMLGSLQWQDQWTLHLWNLAVSLYSSRTCCRYVHQNVLITFLSQGSLAALLCCVQGWCCCRGRAGHGGRLR
jgi:hypothetical protein